MNQVNLKKAAEALDAIAEQYVKLAGIFRVAASGGDGAGDEQPAAGKPAAKSTAKAKKAEVKTDEVLDEDTVREALSDLVDSHGKEALSKVLASVGAGKLSDVDDSQYQELMDACAKAKAKPAEGDDDTPAKPAAKGKASKKAKEVTEEEVKEAFTELLEADKAAAKRVLKAHGATKFSEIDFDEHDHATVLAAIKEAMPEDDDDLAG